MQDTRERLEADISAFMDGRFIGGGLREKVSEWLDRQDAITQRDCIDRWDAKAALRIAELKDQVDELTNVHKKLIAEKAGLEDENMALVEAVKHAEERLERWNKELRDALKAICERYGVDEKWSPIWSADDMVRNVSEGIGQTHMRLPVDADGVPWHIGDKVQRKEHKSRPNVVTGIYIYDNGDHALQVRETDCTAWAPIAHESRHAKPDTVESLLDELLEEANCKVNEDGSCEMGVPYARRADYAERIRKVVEQ